MLNKWFKFGKKVWVMKFNPRQNQDEVWEGRIVGLMRWESMTAKYNKYLVRLKDGRLEFFSPEEIIWKWKDSK